MRRTVRAAVVAALAVVGALLVPGTALAAADLGPVLGALPASASGGGAGDDALNTLVATTCAAGVPLTSPAWFQLPAATSGSVFARARVAVVSSGSPDQMASTRVALVDVTAGTVLSCDGGPATATAARTTAAVVWVGSAEWLSLQAQCSDGSACPQPAEVFVDRGTSAPGNDDVAAATVVGTLPYTTTGSTALATDDGPEGFSACGNIGGQVTQPVSTAWWRWTATTDGYLTATTTATTWSPCTAIVDVDPSAAAPESWYDSEGQARRPFPVVAGHTYLVRVGAEYDLTSSLRPLQTGGPFSLRLAFAAGPGPVTSAAARPTASDALTFTWQPPAAGAGSLPVTGYDVSFARAEPGSDPTVVRLGPTELSTTFSGLALGYYTAAITARTSAGAGQPVEVDAGLLATPGPPALLVSSNSPGEITASWLPPVPAPFTETPDSYRVSLLDTAPGSIAVVRTVATYEALSTTFTGLVSGHAYDVAVVAVSNGGDGTPATRRIELEAAGGSGALASTPIAKVRRGDRSVTVVWTPPAYTGTSGITGYRVRVYLGTTKVLVRTAVVASTRRSAIMGGLVNGRAYTVDVAALNASGAGAVRRSNLVTPATRPSAPVLGRASSGLPGGKRTASVTWSPPRSTGGAAVTGYLVSVWRYDRSGHLLSVTTSSLRPALARSYVATLPLGWYRFSVRAVNAAGTGATTARSVVVVSR